MIFSIKSLKIYIFVIFIAISQVTIAQTKNFNLILYKNKIHSSEITWHNLKATDITAFAESEDSLLLIRKAKGNMYDGIIRGDFRIGANATDFKLVFENINLAKIPRHKAIFKNNYTGNINGELTFSSERTQPTIQNKRKFNMEGEGYFELTNGDLGTLGLVVAIQDILDLPLNKKRRITDARIKFNIENRSLQFKSIELIGDDVEIIGRGRIYYDGRLNLRFRIKAKNQLLQMVPVLGDLLSEVLSNTGSLLPIWVQGTISHPTVNVVRIKNKSKIRKDRK